jgi:transcription initiation factor TFIIIB Brf1 subunit/transcription initiation factor TFIIB
VDKYGISPKIINIANDIYEKVTQNKIFRGKTRKGIIFACVYHAYSLQNTPQSCAHLIKIFEINQKIALKGLKFVNLNSEINSNIHNKDTITTKHLIRETLKEFNATDEQIIEAYELYDKLENRSSLLNRSRPQSVASGIVQYYISRKNPEFSMDYFRKKVKLSELTLTRITKEIETILK